MKKRILLGLAMLLFIFILFIFIRTRPSGNINNYKNYFINDTGQLKENQVKVTFFGVSTLLFDDGETQILLDGFFSRPSILTGIVYRY